MKGKKLSNKTFDVNVDYTFSGTYTIRAESPEMAREIVSQHCGMVMGEKGVHTSWGSEGVDWEFPVHPELKIRSVKQTKPEKP